MKENIVVDVKDLARAPNEFDDILSDMVWVQELLNERICDPYISAVLFFDIACLTLLLIVYRSCAYFR